MKRIHILTDDMTAAVVAGHLKRLGTLCSWGPQAHGEAKYIVEPTAPPGDAQADRLTAHDILRAVRNCQREGLKALETPLFAVRVRHAKPEAAVEAPPELPEAPPEGRKALDGLDVLLALYGRGDVRAAAVARAFERWDRHQAAMPRVVAAWCWAEGDEPEPLRNLPRYDWLERVRLPEYDLDDGVFRKEGLLDLLLREQARAPFTLTLDADVWAEDPEWFRKVRDALSAAGPEAVCQPFGWVRDTVEMLPLPSWSRTATLPDSERRTTVQPGLGWAFARRWAVAHGAEPVFNPWLPTGSGDCMFILEHFAHEMARQFDARHRQYRYFHEVRRHGLPRALPACVPLRLWHECHTDRAAVPEAFRAKKYCDRAYHWSRLVLDLVGDIRSHVRLDARGVPMPVEPDGAFVQVLRRKPEMQDQASIGRIVAEETARALARKERAGTVPAERQEVTR